MWFYVWKSDTGAKPRLPGLASNLEQTELFYKIPSEAKRPWTQNLVFLSGAMTPWNGVPWFIPECNQKIGTALNPAASFWLPKSIPNDQFPAQNNLSSLVKKFANSFSVLWSKFKRECFQISGDRSCRWKLGRRCSVPQCSQEQENLGTGVEGGTAVGRGGEDNGLK